MKKAFFFLAVVLSLSACGRSSQKSGSETAPAQAGTGAALAKLNGEPITADQVREVAGVRLTQAEIEVFEVQEGAIRGIIENRLLDAEAGKRGISRDELIKKEVLDKIKVTDATIQKFYNENKARMGDKKLDEVRDSLRSRLSRDEHQKHFGGLIASLKKKADVEMLIAAPTLKIEVGDAPSIGPEDAPVQLIEFTDYQCPFCGRVRPTISQILSEYKGKVRYVLKDFPLSFHKESFAAHVAAHCAGDQGKYWDYNKKLFNSQRDLQVEDLKKYASEVGLNRKKFDECLDSDKFGETVRKNLTQGQDVGVSGTPAFFVNGRLLSGARPFEDFKELIDSQLARD